MSQHDFFQMFPKMSREVIVGDITVRDGFQHEEKFISTDAKFYYLEQLILAGARHLEVTNLGNPKLMPQFKDAEELFTRLRSEDFKKRLAKAKITEDQLCLTAITIREKAVDRAIELKKSGRGPDRILMMVSTDEEHHYANSGTTLKQYWEEAERSIKKARDAGLEVCGTVSTIWGSPIIGATKLEDALDFSQRWLDIGATSIEHADHDGSASANDVFKYFSMVMDRFSNPKQHIAHFHETKRVGSAAVLSALMAGVSHFEACLGGLGGMPANFVDDCPCGIGDYYFEDEDAAYVGLICLEDTLVQLDEMGIQHGYSIDKVLKLGKQLEKTVGRRLRSEAVINGRTKKEGHPQFARPGLIDLKKKLKEL